MISKLEFLGLLILALLQTVSTLSPSCSPFQTPLPLTDFQTQFPAGCDLDLTQSHYQFTFLLPEYIGAGKLNHSNILLISFSTEEKISFSIESSASLYHIKVTHKSLTKDFRTEQQSISLDISNKTCYLTIGNQRFEIANLLINPSYTLFVEGEVVPLNMRRMEESAVSLSKDPSGCPKDYFLNEDSYCSRVCPGNHYRQDGLCKKCPESCSQCLSETQCNVCGERQAYDEVSESCVEECPKGYFEDSKNKVCIKCAEGCETCSFPEGMCETESLQMTMMFNFIISCFIFLFTVYSAWYCNREKKEDDEKIDIDQLNSEPKRDLLGVGSHGELSPEIKLKINEDPNKQYNVLQDEAEPEPDNEILQRHLYFRRKKQLSGITRNKLLHIAKPFAVDDNNDEQAISHDSTTKMFMNSMLMTAKTDSSPRRLRKGSRDSKDSKDSKDVINDTGKITKASLFAITAEFSHFSPYTPVGNAELRIFKNTSEGKDDKDDAGPPGSFTNRLREIEASPEQKPQEPPLALPEEDSESDVSSESEEDLKKDGYKTDSSMSFNASKEQHDDLTDCTVCKICSINKRDCVIKPCEDVIACYACMEQFAEKYGICPKCQRLITKIEKIKKRRSQEKRMSRRASRKRHSEQQAN